MVCVCVVFTKKEKKNTKKKKKKKKKGGSEPARAQIRKNFEKIYPKKKRNGQVGGEKNAMLCDKIATGPPSTPDHARRAIGHGKK